MKRKPRDLRDYTDWTEEDFAKDLRTHPRYQEFYKDYAPDSISTFIMMYSWSKYNLHKDKARHYSNADHRQSQFLSAAEDFLEVILQKKLFNLQCLWRANLIDLPMIEYTDDFLYFTKEIWDCPYIEPITEKEIEVAIQFLLEEGEDAADCYTQWQNYEGFKVWDADDEDDEDGDLMSPKSLYYASGEPIPEFYIYYDKYMKTSHLFNLPDHRWHKEKYYLDAVRAENVRLHALEEAEKKAKEAAGEPPKTPYLHSLSSHGRDKDKFVETCEDEITKELFAIKSKDVSLNNYDEWETDARFLIELRNQGETIALLPHTDWFDAVSATAAYVRRKKTAEMLPYAYQTYMLSFDDEDIETFMAKRLARFKFDDADENRNWLRKRWRETMAKGRVLRGE